MRFIVCVKLTPDTEELNEVQPEDVGSGDFGVTMVLNPWDEFAVEEALLLQERFGGDTTAITVGDQNSTEALKRAVAMGIEHGVLLSDPAFSGSDAWGIAHILAQAIRRAGEFGLVLTGKQSVDGNSGLVPAGLAVKLGAPFVSEVVSILELTETSVTLQKLVDEGTQTLRVPIPAVISVSKEINEPRYPTFMGIRKASRMSFPAVSASEVAGLDGSEFGAGHAPLQWTDLRKPPARAGKCEFIEGATPAEQAGKLADRLIAEKVI